VLSRLLRQLLGGRAPQENARVQFDLNALIASGQSLHAQGHAAQARLAFEQAGNAEQACCLECGREYRKDGQVVFRVDEKGIV